MKRYRHYTKDKAIILSCFGSVIEQDKYLELKKKIKDKFEDCDIFLSFSSRMVLKDLASKGQEYKNLPQILSDVDMLGYRNIIVSSINIFPTDEHKQLKDTVDGFNKFSLANIRYTNAILTTSKDTTLFLKELNTNVTKDDIANLYIIHGTPKLELGGLTSINYTSDFLKYLSPTNFTCSLEGSMPYFAIKEQLENEIKSKDVQKLQIIPMLLVSGNHYIKDMVEIKDELATSFETSIVPSLSSSDKFNLIELPQTLNIIINNIKDEIVKLG
ncbi:MAG: sirohydrochlorin cobaltochelatase [Arcobacteraceae bacterium]|nr:sirohydrochlorin cobaltochelatase [Arcobacteraceae bacterium]